MPIADNLKLVREKITKAAEKSGRTADDIILVCVTKQATIEQIKEAISIGVDVIGENRVHEAENKFPRIQGKVRKHMIGHLQTNKAKKAVELFDMIESVDSIKLAKEINKRAGNAGKVMPIFIEINISGEEQKYGIRPEELESFLKETKDLKHIEIQGLMTMAPFVEPEETRPYFRKMKELYGKHNFKYLSMGMTNDYEIAIEEGANMVRIGTAIFG